MSVRLYLTTREVSNDNFQFRLQSHNNIVHFTRHKSIVTVQIFIDMKNISCLAAQTDENRHCVYITVFWLLRQIETGTVCSSQCLGCTDRQK